MKLVIGILCGVFLLLFFAFRADDGGTTAGPVGANDYACDRFGNFVADRVSECVGLAGSPMDSGEKKQIWRSAFNICARGEMNPSECRLAVSYYSCDQIADWLQSRLKSEPRCFHHRGSR